MTQGLVPPHPDGIYHEEEEDVRGAAGQGRDPVQPRHLGAGHHCRLPGPRHLRPGHRGHEAGGHRGRVLHNRGRVRFYNICKELLLLHVHIMKSFLFEFMRILINQHSKTVHGKYFYRNLI